MTVAIDGYCWLHQGAYQCAADLAYGRGTDLLMKYCRRKLKLLLSNNVTPVLVFDGAKLKMKSGVE